MKTSLPYAFTVRYMQPGRTSSSTTHMVGYVSAEVPDLAWHEVAPVAEWTKNGGAGTPDTRHRCISYEGGLYVSVRNDAGHTLSRLPKFAGDPMSDPSFGSDILGKNMLSRAEENLLRSAFTSDAKGVSRFGLAGIADSNQKRNEAIAKQCVTSLIFADGQVWRKVPWIGLELSSFMGDLKLEVAVGDTGFDNPGTDLAAKLFQAPGSLRRFGLREMERVREHASGSKLWFTFKNLVSQYSAPEIASEEEFLLRCARYAVRKTMDDVGDMTPDAVRDWLAIRDAYESHVCGAVRTLPDDLGETIRRFTPHIPDDRARDHMQEATTLLDIYDAEREPGAKPGGPASPQP
ncbi:hypothetical protein OIU34_23740 [Pararhizobium sp. BT-229]|uniref:hypothetical protein n=1 Tax=Pararhizobium sp. BT-229 TaxID=2986923 RepID=UPI0021F6B7E5|nr:hypothetical protein [Pararhizobium sp. BT-229]MCV9964910.1 hypothetical protein [Pararhizobium sp. BT-229]